MFSIFSQKPDTLGAANGRLAPCPPTPNCVCTQCDDAEHGMEPLHFQGDPAAALERLRTIVTGLPRTRIVTDRDGYLHVEFTSLIFRFVDDVEFLVEPATRTIHFRSASRVGRSDLGVNRRRMEEIRRQFE